MFVFLYLDGLEFFLVGDLVDLLVGVLEVLVLHHLFNQVVVLVVLLLLLWL